MSNLRRSSYWRDQARERIEKVVDIYLKANPERPVDVKNLKREISKAYPFGKRENHPYKVWLDEVKKQVEYFEFRQFDKTKPPKLQTYSPLRGQPKKLPPVPPGQLGLFDEL